jgi:hypothetical protein
MGRSLVATRDQRLADPWEKSLASAKDFLLAKHLVGRWELR